MMKPVMIDDNFTLTKIKKLTVSYAVFREIINNHDDATGFDLDDNNKHIDYVITTENITEAMGCNYLHIEFHVSAKLNVDDHITHHEVSVYVFYDNYNALHLLLTTNPEFGENYYNFTKAMYKLVSINYRKSVKNIVQQLQFIFL